jgi:hypothetical protein
MAETKRAAERATQIEIPIVLEDTDFIAPSLRSLQASRVRRLYALTVETAATIAVLAYGVMR